MASFIRPARAKETSATTGTGTTITLGGAVAGYDTFANEVGDTNQAEYILTSGSTDYEVGLGHYTLSGNTFSRDFVIQSSNSNNKINLTTGTIITSGLTAATLASLRAGPIVPPPKASNWTQRNFAGSTTLTDVGNGVSLYATSTNGSIVNVLRAATIVAPATPYTIDMNFSANFYLPAANYQKVGALWTDGTKAHIITTNDIAVSPNFAIENYSAFGTYASVTVTAYDRINFGDFCMRLSDDGTNASFSYSADGAGYMPLYSVAKASGYLGASGYTNVGFFVNEQVMGNTGAGTLTLRSWYKH